MRNILYIVPSDYDSLKQKGVIDLILQRDEGGFFNKVFTLHPFTKNNKVIKLKENNIIFEYGWKSSLDFLNKFRITKIFRTLIILLKLIFIFPFIIKKEKISIIRATDPYYMGLIALYYSKLLKIPFIVSVHSDYDKGAELGGQTFKVLGSRKIAKQIEKFVYKKADLILPISNYLKRKIIDQYEIDENNIDVFYHGVSFENFDNTKFLNIKEIFNIDKPYILGYIARLSKEKQCLDILYITKELVKMRNDFCILVAGNGPEYNYMNSFIKKNNLENNIKLIGFQSKNIVFTIKKQSNINICLLDGFSLIEACASGKPVIAYDTEWHSELIKDNTSGLLVKENDIKEMVNKIDYLLNNEKLSHKLGKYARELAFQNHSLKNSVKNKQNIYHKILKKFGE
ncbi:glycosyltransferase family 4 protein [Sulfurimonas paralvinellae]|uniref:Glycosyltransferase family 4 protein n=1 Tax=Sulfurimonas paralvinellae TaxID=317658 RepID=A0A7M1B8T6_9BACT|nr:glycosyltransferase family 4 protein [Sulfurimonas paralvinellae]QOP45836.1 glycosyltransferase family 4 protein [Sulfurimonas paralvinellae]